MFAQGTFYDLLSYHYANFNKYTAIVQYIGLASSHTDKVVSPSKIQMGGMCLFCHSGLLQHAHSTV